MAVGFSTVSERGLDFIKGYEGCALKAYRCPANVITIGYGATNSDEYAKKVLGGPITMNSTCTLKQADDILRASIERQYTPPTVKAGLGIKQNALDCGTSFHYNTGRVSTATWVKRYLAGDMTGAREGLMQYNKGGGRVLAGLTRRRKDEVAMLLEDKYNVQASVMIGPDGRPTGKTVPKTPGGVPTQNPGMLDLGSTGDDVEAVQKDLQALDYLSMKIVLGTYDSVNKKAVERFQKDHPALDVDGVTGPATRAALQRAADMRRYIKKRAAETGTINTGGSVATYLGMPWWLWVAVGLAGAALVGYTAWKYRDEVRQWLNKNLGDN